MTEFYTYKNRTFSMNRFVDDTFKAQGRERGPRRPERGSKPRSNAFYGRRFAKNQNGIVTNRPYRTVQFVRYHSRTMHDDAHVSNSCNDMKHDDIKHVIIATEKISRHE